MEHEIWLPGRACAEGPPRRLCAENQPDLGILIGSLESARDLVSGNSPRLGGELMPWYRIPTNMNARAARYAATAQGLSDVQKAALELFRGREDVPNAGGMVHINFGRPARLRLRNQGV